ncbi:plasmid mobilization protein [Paraburkholderia dinghuensis]|uniref:MobB mobilization protein n=1 Tax=Paraburkholderia dinghuensis TaxID=2305225 RepID=A0A3N6Q368_9BURK|nr:MobB mobilization protein [Paraburkholderia dinghuensis]RQH09600.1 MobB mobilization protein [Paraburkholderia dinghuensis]
MPFEQKGTEPLDASVTIRLSVSERDRLKEDADLAGLTVSELVRRRYFNRPIAANVDRAYFKGLLRIRSELGRVGGLLKHVHVESGGSYSAQTAEALRTVTATVESVRSYMEAVHRETAGDR